MPQNIEQDHAWVSNAWADSTLILNVRTDLSAFDPDSAIAGNKLNVAGKPVPIELCPKKIWGNERASNFTTMPDLFMASDQWIVSERAADILRQSDLGGGALYPISEGVYQKDELTRVSGNYFCWIFGNQKQALLPEASVNLRPPSVPGLWWKMPWTIHDNDIAVSRVALFGPDVWLDKTLFNSIFVSGALGDAIDRAGLRDAFRLNRCRLI